MYRSGFGVVLLLVACGGSEFSSQTSTGPSGTGGASSTSSTDGSGGDGTSSVATGPTTTATTTVGTGSGGNTGSGGPGSATSTVGAGGGSGNTGGAAGTGSGGTGSGGSGVADAGTSEAGGVNCPELAAELGRKLAAAQVCNPNDPVQCLDLVEGLCCQVPVASKDSDPTRTYLTVLAKYKANCSIGCPAIPCMMTTGVCKPNPDSPNMYSCQRLAGG